MSSVEHTGLSSQEAQQRLHRDGPNELPALAGPSVWRELARQLVHFFALMLWAAAALAFLAGMTALGVAIMVVVVVNGLVAFAQEYRAERAAQRLGELLPRRSTVLRDGMPVRIDASQLVVGDVVLLRTGDRISADMRTLEAHALAIDRSTLTGESVPVSADVGTPLEAGCFVVEGEGTAEITAIGNATRLAEIARITRAERRAPSPLAVELHRVVRTIALIAVALGASFFVVTLLLGISVVNAVMFAIGVTVALVPEALLPTLTLSLAMAARRMSGRNALVRRLESVETLGSTTFICTDKTGTLTTNRMTVVEVWTPSGSARITGAGYEPTAQIEVDGDDTRDALREIARAGALCSTGTAALKDGQWVAHGDPLEVALDVLARRVAVDAEAAQGRQRARRFPFDARRRRMSVVAGDEVLVKGAPEAVLPVCRTTPGVGPVLQTLTERGLRVLAIARRTLEPDESVRNGSDAERGLELLGILALEDPPRPGVADSIAACRRAGVKLAMITGDHPATAKAIAQEVGLLGPARVVVTGEELPRDDEALAMLLDHDGIVISRVAPEDKMRIARALRSRGHVVAMFGDGVNDGPALQTADIGVAMGRTGTDVAREAADLILLDDDFSTVVVAIAHGRATYANIQRFLTYHLTDNVAEVTPFVIWAVSGGTFPLALGVLQVLALDIGTDTFPAVALGAEPPRPHIMDGPPPKGHLLDRGVAVRVFGVIGPVEAAMSMAAFLVSMASVGWTPGAPFPTGAALLSASGATFAAVVCGQIANAFACRSKRQPPWVLGWFRNTFLVATVAVEIVIAAGFLFLPLIDRVLGHASPNLAGWIVALLAAPAVLLADAIHKGVLRRQERSASPKAPRVHSHAVSASA